MNMKKRTLLILLAGTVLFSACAPQAFVMNSEMRQPSKSGLNLGGKSIAVAYLYGEDPRDTLFNNAVASGFAGRLEEDYFGGAQRIELFKLKRDRRGDYASKDSLVNLVLDTGRDVVFLFDVPEFGVPTLTEPRAVGGRRTPADSACRSTAKLPFSTKLYVYDSMNPEDRVLAYAGSNNLAPTVYSDGKTSVERLAKRVWQLDGTVAEAGKAGEKAAASFLSTWKEDSFHVIYYEGAEPAWNKAADYAYRYQWKEAIDTWMTLLKARNREKRSCAAYNIALGCFMAGQPDLALEWLDRSDSEMPVSLSSNLRRQIKTYTGKSK